MTATQWLEVIASYSMQVGVVVVACRLLEGTLVKTSERCALWSNCFLCILFLGCAVVLLPRLHLIQPWAELEPHLKITISTSQTIVGGLLLAAWSVGTSVALLRWITQGIKLRRFLNHCYAMPADEVTDLFVTAQIPFDNQKMPSVMVHDGLEGPFCRQVHSPTIVLPRFLVEGAIEDLRYVLLHEMEHLKTQHPLQLFWQQIVQVTCWFHPAVWRAGSRASLMREYLCDEAAIRQDANCAGYLRALLRIAQNCQETRIPSAIGFGRAPSEIMLRARRLVTISQSGSAQWQRGLFSKSMATLTLAGVTCLLTLVWIPIDPLSSSRSLWSPWPSWTAKTANCFGYKLRDYEVFDRRSQYYEVMRETMRGSQAITSSDSSESDL